MCSNIDVSIVKKCPHIPVALHVCAVLCICTTHKTATASSYLFTTVLFFMSPSDSVFTELLKLVIYEQFNETLIWWSQFMFCLRSMTDSRLLLALCFHFKRPLQTFKHWLYRSVTDNIRCVPAYPHICAQCISLQLI